MSSLSAPRNDPPRPNRGHSPGLLGLASLVLLLVTPGCTNPVRLDPATQGSASASHSPLPATSASGPSPVPSRTTLPAMNPNPHRETAILAGGCFWGMQELLRQIPGVLSSDVGYSGGTTRNPTYDDVHLGTTGHAEAVRIVFDPGKLSYSDLLEKWFFRMHDPTTSNRQGNDVGSQYRSAIFVTTEEQRSTALAVKSRVDQSGKWKRPIVTEIVEAGPFTPAEGYHQDYLQKNPGGYTCHYLRD